METKSPSSFSTKQFRNAENIVQHRHCRSDERNNSQHSAESFRKSFGSIERIAEEIHVLNEAIEEITSKYAESIATLQTLPGVKKTGAESILAEVGPFATSKQLAK